MSDLISRTELWNRLARVPISQYAVDERTMIHNVINGMPTAETTGDLDDAIQEYIKSGLMEFDDFRPKGHWIFDTEDGYYKCSECGSLAEIDSVTNNYWRSNFCPQCGADMRPKLIGKHADVTIIDEACMKGADDE